MSDRLWFEFAVDVPVAEAFDAWTKRISTWWPVKHTRSRELGTTVVIEPQVGGRIFERTAAGEEHDWGAVTVWRRPECFGYSWHITSRPEEATHVEIRFTQVHDRTTRITIEHTGFETLGASGAQRREANRRYWEALIPSYLAACEQPR